MENNYKSNRAFNRESNASLSSSKQNYNMQGEGECCDDISSSLTSGLRKELRTNRSRITKNIDFNDISLGTDNRDCLNLNINFVEVRGDHFEHELYEKYSKYSEYAQENIKRLLNPNLNRDMLRARVLAGFPPVYNQVPKMAPYTSQVHPVFYTFGLLLPFLTNILESDMNEAFRKICKDTLRMEEQDELLFKTILMSDVKLTQQHKPLTDDENLTAISYINLLMHVITNSLYKVSAEDHAKYVDPFVTSKLNSLLSLKLLTPPIVHPINENDDYIVKTFRKLSLLFGKKPVIMKVSKQNVFSVENKLEPVFDNKIQEHVDSFVIDINNKSHWETSTGRSSSSNNFCDQAKDCDLFFETKERYDTAKKDCDPRITKPDGARSLSIKKALETPKTYSKDGKLYTTKFDSSMYYLPVVINRKEKVRKNDYSKVLLGSSCKSRLQRNINDERYDKVKINKDDLDKSFTIGKCTYYPYLYLGTFKDRKGIDDDVDFIMANMNDDIVRLNRQADADLYGTKYKPPPKSTDPCAPTTGSTKNIKEECESFGNLMEVLYNASGKTEGCCEYTSEHRQNLRKFLRGGVEEKFLITSNKTCLIPLTIKGEAQKEALYPLLQQSVTLIIYLVDCADQDECVDYESDKTGWLSDSVLADKIKAERESAKVPSTIRDTGLFD